MHESRKEKTVQKKEDFIGSEGRRIRPSRCVPVATPAD